MGGVRSARTYGFDVFRCVALAIVLATHGFLAFFVSPGLVPWTTATTFWTFAATVSIDWFFVLSGCLIGAMMIRGIEGSGSWWQAARSFWLRRWFRTIPNYVLFLLVNVALVALAVAPGPARLEHAFFAQNLFGDSAGWFFIESWSLAVEEWFYLLAPVLVGVGALAFRAQGRAAFLVAALLLVAIPPVLRFASPVPADLFVWDEGIRRAVVMHLDAPGWGVLAAITSRWAPAFWASARRRKLALAVLATLLGLTMVLGLDFGGPFAAVPRLSNAFGLTLCGFGAYLALPWLSGLRAPSSGWGHAFAAGTDWSYSIYLAHLPLAYILIALLPTLTLRSVWPALAAWVVLTIVLSAGLFHGFERPIARLRDRHAPKVDATPFIPAGRAPQPSPTNVARPAPQNAKA